MNGRFRYVQDGANTTNGKVYIDDVDVSYALSGFTMYVAVGDIGRVELHMPMLGIAVETKGDVGLSSHDEQLLDLLGWERKT